MKGYWTCRRVTAGRKCQTLNSNGRKVCEMCGKRRPPRKVPAHRAVLKAMTYEDFIVLNGGEHCAICGATRKPDGRRLHRDHDHRTAEPRGLLCFRDNSALRSYMTADWLRAALAYVERCHEGYSAGIVPGVPDTLEDRR